MIILDEFLTSRFPFLPKMLAAPLEMRTFCYLSPFRERKGVGERLVFLIIFVIIFNFFG